MATNETLIPIPGRLHSVATEGHVSGADEIYDDSLNKDQATINQEVNAALGEGGTVDEKIAEAIDDALEDVAFIDDSESSPAVLPGFDPTTDTVHVTAQTLSEQQKAQVRTNIGLGDVDAKINEAVASEASQRASAVSGVQASVNAEASRAQAAEQSITSTVTSRLDTQDAEIALLNGAEVIVVEDHTQVSSPDSQKIYREIGDSSYTDWMNQTGNANDWKAIATYNPGIDDEPTAGSNNLVKSGGVFNRNNKSIKQVSEILDNVDGYEEVSFTEGYDGQILDGTTDSLRSGYSGFYTSEYIALDPKTFDYTIWVYGDLNDNRFADAAFYDEDKKLLFIYNSVKSPLIKQKWNLLDISGLVKFVRFSYYGTTTHKTLLYKASKQRYDVNPELSLGYPKRLKDMTKLSYTISETDSIFGKAAEGYETSDYIAISQQHNKHYFAYLGNFSTTYTGVEFYDSNKKRTGLVNGSYFLTDKLMELTLPKGTTYIRFAKISSNNVRGIYVENDLDFEEVLEDAMKPECFADTNNILWLGTSIPEGCTYPEEASKKCGYNCTNNAYGGSQLCWTGERPSTVDQYSGRCLTATVSELEAMFRQDVTAGTITEETLQTWKNKSYEVSVLPYINGSAQTQVSMIVLDHGFNDRQNIHSIMQDADNIDWLSRDRSNFVGAFNYLMDKIQEINPFTKIVIAGYFQESITFNDYYSKDICDMQSLIASHYGISIMKAWEHTQINNSYVKGTDDYLSDFNTEYGTSYTKWNPDTNGNITSFQLYCPDRVHPFSDLSGNSDRRLNAVYSKLLRDSI